MTQKSLVQLGFIALSALAVYFFVSMARDADARGACTSVCLLGPAYANQNRSLPTFELPDLDGKRVSSAELRGRVTVLNFWTKTCRPCLEEMGSLDELAEIVQREGLAVDIVTINTDASADDAKTTLAAVLGRAPRFKTLVDPDAAVVFDKFGTRLYPETWLIDPAGVIRLRVDGAREWSNPIVLDVLRALGRPGGGCGITFDAGKAHGQHRGLCGGDDDR
ncbi:MAG: TlpA family protein disulfide reductase [Polyangiaceae bacterium]|nr:TlpA family protein disulfide reductase [Polyangiaceae bacterium]